MNPTTGGTARSLVSAIIAVVIGVALTAVAAAFWATPWTLGQAMVAVGAASFCAAFFADVGASRERGRR